MIKKILSFFELRNIKEKEFYSKDFFKVGETYRFSKKEEIFLVSKIEKGVIYAFGFDSKNNSFAECAYFLEGRVEKNCLVEKVPRLIFTEKIRRVLREKKYTILNCEDINKDTENRIFAKVEDMSINYYSTRLPDNSFSVRVFSQGYGNGGFCLFFNGIFAKKLK